VSDRGSGGAATAIHDPEYVRRQYAREDNLAARSSLYAETTGLHAGDIAVAALVEAAPGRVLEVGCGNGWFAARVRDEVGAEVACLDQSPRMVELAAARGLDARVGDVQKLPFAAAAFDAAAANWMLYHVADVDRALAELARVLRPGGRLVAITNGADHLAELWALVGAGDDRPVREMTFSAENGAELLQRRFARVERRDAGGTVTISDRSAIERYLGSSERLAPLAATLPDDLALPLVARRSNVVFVADA
jgi:SAM-dependent methyltransferase